MADRPSLTQRYEQMNDTLSDVTATVTRIDERVDIFIDQIKTLDRKVDHHLENCPIRQGFSDLVGRISVIESKNGTAVKTEFKEMSKEINREIKELRAELGNMKLAAKDVDYVSNASAKKWRTVGWVVLNIFTPLVWVIIASYILFYLGITSPPTP